MPKAFASVVAGLLLSTCAAASPTQAVFAVSGDSRDCGNIVMPAIAAGARRDGAAFYWHLGDFRAIFRVDQDFAQERRFTVYQYPPAISDYLYSAWPDFTQHQLAPFGDMPVMLGIGNHEIIPPKSMAQYRIAFLPWLDLPWLREQRLEDAQRGAVPGTAPDQTYNHWRSHGVDFVNLDNATNDAFDESQLKWLDAVLDAALADPAVKSIVVGLHDPLPHSMAADHSMCDTDEGLRTGLRVYRRLAEVHRHKPVYVIASHAHYYLSNVYDTPYWRASKEGVLPGWIVGTAGAERYPLPPGASARTEAAEHTYGYLLGQIGDNGQVHLTFRPLGEAELQAHRGSDFDEAAVHACVAANPVPEVIERKRLARLDTMDYCALQNTDDRGR